MAGAGHCWSGLWWLGFWVLLTEMTRGESATGTFCPKCPTHHPADCNINENSRTITCVVNTTTCDLVQCTNDDRCFIHFFNSTTGDFWTLASLCAHFDGEGPCLLEPSYEGSNAFPPPNGMECRCTVNCSLDRPLVYVHPFPPDEVSSLVSSIRPSVTPTNDTCAGHLSPALTGYVVAGAVLVFVILLSLIASSAILLHYWRKGRLCLKTRHTHSSHSRQRNSVSNLTDDEPPFQLGHLVSRGRYGAVYRTEYEGELVAVKVFSYQNRVLWENERTLFGMQSIKHRNVIDYIVGGMWGAGYQLQMFIITPFFLLGSLNRFLARNTVSWEQACRVIHSIASGLGHLHSESYLNSDGITVEKYAVAHRDVKSANILVRGENGDCVLSDLGFAVILDPARDEKDMANTGQVGTYRYMAPEVLDARINLLNIQSFKQIDVYALGLVMWEVVWRCNVQEEESPREYLMAYEDTVGKRPGIDTMREVVCTEKLRPRILPAWRNHSGLRSLVGAIEECWDEDPEARLSANNVVLRLKELVDGGSSALASDHTSSHTFLYQPVVPGNDQFRLAEVLESTTDTMDTTDSRPPPYDSRWSYAAVTAAANSGDGGEGEEEESSSSVSMELNINETTV